MGSKRPPLNSQVLDIGRSGQLSTGCESIRQHSLEHDRLKVGPSQVNGSRVSSWTRTDDDNLVMSLCRSTSPAGPRRVGDRVPVLHAVRLSTVCSSRCHG